MIIDIYTSSVSLNNALREHIDRRFRSALSWADRHLNKVSIRLVDVNGPKGGIDKSCQILIPVSHGRPVFISEIQTDIYAAIDRALERAGQTLKRRLQRSRSQRHIRSGLNKPVVKLHPALILE